MGPKLYLIMTPFPTHMQVVCAQCSPNTLPLPKFGWHKDVRVCTSCYIEQLGQATRTVLAQIQNVQVQ